MYFLDMQGGNRDISDKNTVKYMTEIEMKATTIHKAGK